MFKLIPMAMATVATASIMMGTHALAQTSPERVELTRADAEKRAGEAFSRLDVNKDGQLNQADRDAQARLRFDATDTDGNGQLSFAEVTAEREKRRELGDERRAARSERSEQRAEARSERGMRSFAGRRGMRGGMDRGMGGRMMERADTDNNGTITQAEFTSAALARFDSADANSDGTISADERRGQRGDRGDRRSNRGQRG